MIDKQIRPTDTALEKLEKILPAPATAAFLAIKAFIDVSDSSGSAANLIPYIIFGVIIFICLLIPLAARAFNGIKDIYHQIIMTITFFIWAVNIEFLRIMDMDSNFVLSNAVLLKFIIPISLILWAILLMPLSLSLLKPVDD